MIADRDTLYNAAMGKPVKPEPRPPKPSTPQSITASQLPADYSFDPATYPSASTLANLLATGTTSYGRTSKGKYGGFYSAGDLESAIKGSAINLRENVAGQLENIAGQRMSTLGSMRGEALAGAGREIYSNPYRNFVSPAAAQAPAMPGMSAPAGGFVAKYVNPLRDYSAQLADWYSEQAKPAEDYLATASQIKSTPMSELASSIATQQYGMNPNLARGKFSNLDIEYFPTARNKAYMERYGKTYDQYKFEEEMASKEQKAFEASTDKFVKSELSKVTGLAPEKLATASGQTANQMYEVLSRSYDLNGEIYNGTDVVNEIRTLIDNGDTGGAIDFVKQMQSTSGGQDLAMLLNAILKYYVVRPYETGIDLDEVAR